MKADGKKMCLYPKLIQNPKYRPNKKNGGNVPEVRDVRVKYVPIGCQKCMECKKQKARQWSVRLQEEIKRGKPEDRQFVTLTFSNESIRELYRAVMEEREGEEIEGYALDNAIATIGTRRFLERWRKKYKKSVKHWLVTELGHNGTENVHLHGIIWSKDKEEIKKIWRYGFVYVGDYVSERTINYISKYVTKVDLKHSQYNAIILTSPGIGSNYANTPQAKENKYKEGGKTKDNYVTKQGQKLNLPIYYRNKLYTEEERENLWLEKLDKQIRYVNGREIDISKGLEKYLDVLKHAQHTNSKLGYGNGIDWKKKGYEETLRGMNLNKRLKDREPMKSTEEEKYLRRKGVYDKFKEYEKEIDRDRGNATSSGNTRPKGSKGNDSKGARSVDKQLKMFG